MIAMLPHPSRRVLERALDEELGARDAELVTRHVRDCTACAEHMTRIGALGERLRARPVPALPANLVEAAVARRIAGERVLVPLKHVALPAPVNVRAGRSRRWLVGASAAAAAAAAVAVFTLAGPTENLTAGAATSALQFSPPHPRAGQTVGITYHASAKMPESGPLVVRAQLWDADAAIGRDTIVVAATLQRSPDGVWRGTFVLPATFAYGVFAVEDSAGSVVDYDPRALYDLVPSGANGQAPLNSLVYHARMLQQAMGYDAVRRKVALAAARDITERYPDSPRGWMLRERLEGPEPGGFSIVKAWLTRWRRLSTLDAALRAQRKPNPTEMLALGQYARAIDVEETADEWFARVVADSTSEDPEVISWRLSQWARRKNVTPDQIVVEYEDIATQRPAYAPLVYFYAIQAAAASQDSTAFGRVIDACRECRDVISPASVREVPALRRALIPRLRAWMAENPPLLEADRLLGYTRSGRIHGRALYVAQRHASLAGLLAMDGRPREAIAEYETSERLARAAHASPYFLWNHSVLHQLRAYMAVGDTANALRVWARAAILWPGAKQYQADALAALGNGIGAARRDAALAEVRPAIDAERADALADADSRRTRPLPLTFRYYRRGF